MNIITKIEGKRGCGYRKPGGIYFVMDGPASTCYKLPIALTVCPCCNAGIKPTRGFTWINSNLFYTVNCEKNVGPFSPCDSCAANMFNTKMGLLWIGEKFYATPTEFVRESGLQGISRRISQVPKEFVVGETWIALAHRKAISAIGEKGKIEQAPGIFSFFRPQRIEYIITGEETTEQLEKLEKRGFTLIKIIKDIEAQTSFLNE